MNESDLQTKVADYLLQNYPDVLFHSDFGSGIKLTIGQATKQKRQNGGRRAWPDMFIAKPKMPKSRVITVPNNVPDELKPMRVPNPYANKNSSAAESPFCEIPVVMFLEPKYGLFLELKKDGETLFPGPRAKKRFKSIDGEEYKNEHFMEQADVLFKLRKAGYAAEFAVGFDETKKIITDYLGEPVPNKIEF